MSSDSEKREREFMAELKEAFEGSFDLTEPYEFAGTRYDLKAVYNIRHSQYAISKKIEIFGYEMQEIHLFRFLPGGATSQAEDTTGVIRQNVRLLFERIREIVSPGQDHMCTLINLCFIGKPLSDEEAGSITGMGRHRGFLFGLRGWADIAVTYIDLQTRTVFCSSKMKSKKEAFEKILASYKTRENGE